MMSGMGSNDAGMLKMMRGMLSGMASMMNQMSEDSAADEGCCGGMIADEDGGKLAQLAKQCRPLLEQMRELFSE